MNQNFCFAEFYFSRFVCLSHKTDSIELGVKSLRQRHIWLVDRTELAEYASVYVCACASGMRCKPLPSHPSQRYVQPLAASVALFFVISFDRRVEPKHNKSVRLLYSRCVSLSIRMRACARALFGRNRTHTHRLVAQAPLYWCQMSKVYEP